MEREVIGSRLKKLRVSKGETQCELAEVLHVTPAAISLYELGQRMPSDETKMKYSRHYGVSVQDLFFTEQANNM